MSGEKEKATPKGVRLSLRLLASVARSDLVWELVGPVDCELEDLDFVRRAGDEVHSDGLVATVSVELAVDRSRGFFGRDPSVVRTHQGDGDAFESLFFAGDDDRRGRPSDVFDLNGFPGNFVCWGRG